MIHFRIRVMGQGDPKMQSLMRGLDVIRSVMDLEPCSLQQLHDATGLPKPSLLRILEALETAGIVFRPIDDKRYRLSANNFLMRRTPDLRVALQEVSVPVLSKLCRDAVWPSDLVIPDGNRMVVISSNRMLSPFAIKPSAHGHQPDMLLTAVGRVYLAFSAEHRRSEIIGAIRSENPGHRMLRDEDALSRLLLDTRQRGYGIRSEHKADGFGAIAVPVLVRNDPIACLNLFYYKSAISQDNVVKEHLSKLVAAADEIVKRLTASSSDL